VALAIACALTSSASLARAAPVASRAPSEQAPSEQAPPPAAESRSWARSETHFRHFQRALWPGPRGSIVSEQTLAPVYQLVSAGLRDAATPLSDGGLDAEVSAWGQAQPTDASPEPRLDADVSIAYPFYVDPFPFGIYPTITYGDTTSEITVSVN
jgi:hypothetical protein